MARIYAAFSYVFGAVSGIAVFLFMDNDYDRFHAMQSCLLSVLLAGSAFALAGIAIGIKLITGADIGIEATLAFLIALLLFGLASLVLIWKASNGELVRLPLIGKEAERMSKIK